MSKYAVIQFACNLNAITYFFMRVKICGLILDQGDYLLRSSMKGKKSAKENPVYVEFDFPWLIFCLLCSILIGLLFYKAINLKNWTRQFDVKQLHMDRNFSTIQIMPSVSSPQYFIRSARTFCLSSSGTSLYVIVRNAILADCPSCISNSP